MKISLLCIAIFSLSGCASVVSSLGFGPDNDWTEAIYVMPQHEIYCYNGTYDSSHNKIYTKEAIAVADKYRNKIFIRCYKEGGKLKFTGFGEVYAHEVEHILHHNYPEAWSYPQHNINIPFFE